MHTAVLAEEVLKLLRVESDGIYVDVTGGAGGHAELILQGLGKQGRLYIFDCDATAVTRLREKFLGVEQVKVEQARFSEFFEFLSAGAGAGVLVNGLIADLGISSWQLDDARRGISIQGEGPLDMRLDERLEITAADLLKELSDTELADIFFTLGEEKHSRLIARAIVHDRTEKPFLQTSDLSGLAERVLGKYYRGQKLHPARRIFQALRLKVNHELEELSVLLGVIPKLLKPQGRAGIISFHSLEDRRVKQAFRGLKQAGWNLLTKKPVIPTEVEQKQNPRSRSAKLRFVEARAHLF